MNHGVGALLFIINGAGVSGMEKHDAVQSVREFFQHNRVKDVGPEPDLGILAKHSYTTAYEFSLHELYPKHFRIQHAPDVGALDKSHRIMRESSRDLIACPESCNNKALCDCLISYYYTEETCLSIELSACKDPFQFALCNPVDVYKDYHEGMNLAITYAVCPAVDCLNSMGLASMYDNLDMTYACSCEGGVSFCAKCEEIKDVNPFCNWWLATYEGLCDDIIDCCVTETGREGLLKCSMLLQDAKIKNYDESVMLSDETEKTHVDNVMREELSSPLQSSGAKCSDSYSVIVVATIAGVVSLLPV